MKTSDFYYDLPKELIAQTPLEPRDSSRLLVLDREKQTLEHKHFYDIIDYLNEGDLLVASRVKKQKSAQNFHSVTAFCVQLLLKLRMTATE